MAASVRCRFGTAELPARSIDAGVSAFLDGVTNGEEPLHALYDHILAEPIPQSMRSILREPQRVESAAKQSIGVRRPECASRRRPTAARQ